MKDNLKILYCCHLNPGKSLGASKVYVEAYEGMRRLGVEAELIGPETYAKGINYVGASESNYIKKLSPELKKYLEGRAKEFDVVETEAMYLPFRRSCFPLETLMVSRSILLINHLAKFQFPRLKGLRPLLSELIKGGERKKDLDWRIQKAMEGFRQCDVINIPNPMDKEQLINDGIEASKIGIFPYGISSDRKKELAQGPEGKSLKNKIAFVGTFDRRKGAVEFPAIISNITSKYPNLKFKLLGVTGLFPNADAVIKYFPKKLHEKIEVIETFNPDELALLLSDCSIGIFPSWLESFGFGLLEMLAAGLPVAAYDVPGPSLILPKDWLAKRGDWMGLCDIMSRLIDNHPGVNACEKIVDRFSWDKSSKENLAFYRQKMLETRIIKT